MPRGDGTGPAGMGPMTGRAAGYCAGFSVPGYANPSVPRMGMRRGRGRGRGPGRGFGRGFRFSRRPSLGFGRRYPDMMYPPVAAGSDPYYSPYSRVTEDDQLAMMEDELALLREEREAIKERIEELSDEIERMREE